MHFRQFNPNLHNIFAERAVLRQNWRTYRLAIAFLIRTTPDSFEKPYYFYAEPVRNESTAHHLTASPLKCWRKKQVPAAICITFHPNFTIRSGDHSNFRCFPPFPVSRSGPAFRKRININFSLAISAKPPNQSPRHTLHCTL